MKCYGKNLLCLCFIAVTLYACKKEAPVCTGNCAEVTISGKVFNINNNKGITGVPVEVDWLKAVIFSDTYKITSGKTNTDGSFAFHVTLDTGFFKDYFLAVRIPIDTNYIGATNFGSGPEFYEQRFYQFAPAAMSNVKFPFYPKASLTINLHRTLSDNFQYFSVEHNFTNQYIIGDYTITTSQNANDTSFTVATSADIYTKIIWTKTIATGNIVSKTDSVICSQNAANVFNISY